MFRVDVARSVLGFALIGALLAAAPAPASGQAQPYSLDQVVTLLSGGVPHPLILNRVQADCISFRVDADAESRLRTAGANDEFIAALRSICYRDVTPPAEAQPPSQPPAQPAASPTPLYSPGSAAVRSLLVPGLGQFYTGRPALGVVFLGAAGGALAAGVLSQKITQECLDRTHDGSCPPDQVRSEVVERPYLLAGLGGAVAVAVISALEARSAANRMNARRIGAAGEPRAAPPPGPRLALPALAPSLYGVRLDIIRVRF